MFGNKGIVADSGNSLAVTIGRQYYSLMLFIGILTIFFTFVNVNSGNNRTRCIVLEAILVSVHCNLYKGQFFIFSEIVCKCATERHGNCKRIFPCGKVANIGHACEDIFPCSVNNAFKIDMLSQLQVIECARCNVVYFFACAQNNGGISVGRRICNKFVRSLFALGTIGIGQS